MAKRGERRAEILQALASMLENPKQEKVTTAALAAYLQVSEAALYRHFASKAQMFDALIEFIESALFSLINKLQSDTLDGLDQVSQIVSMLLGFAEKNRGMMRVLTGEALTNENERLQARINQIFDKLEASLRQSFRVAQISNQIPRDYDVSAHAAVLMAYVLGRWQLFVKSGFRLSPSKNWPEHKKLLLNVEALEKQG
jgi:TetR/AcrR family transcriptional regulator